MTTINNGVQLGYTLHTGADIQMNNKRLRNSCEKSPAMWKTQKNGNKRLA